MIKIANKDGRNLTELSNYHYKNLINYIVGKLDKIGKSIADNDESVKCILESPNSSNLIKFIKDLSASQDNKKSKANLEEIITCKAAEFDDLYDRLDTEYHLRESFKNKDIVEQFKNIFSYSNFKTERQGYSAYKLVEKLNIPTCPYCNRTFINTVTFTRDGKEVQLRPHLDHFYPQSKYPIFALSFFNLIPSCSFCNTNLKGDDDCTASTHIHPYRESFGDDAKFRYDEIGLLENSGETKLQIKNDQRKERLEGSKELFQLEAQYKIHTELAKEIFEKALEENDDHFNSLMSVMKDINPNREDFYKFYFGNYAEEKDFEKRPLSKFTRDLVDDLGILKKAGLE